MEGDEQPVNKLLIEQPLCWALLGSPSCCSFQTLPCISESGGDQLLSITGMKAAIDF